MTWTLHVEGHTDEASKEAGILSRVRGLLGDLARNGNEIIHSSFEGRHTGNTADLHAVPTTPAPDPTAQAPLPSVPATDPEPAAEPSAAPATPETGDGSAADPTTADTKGGKA